VKSLRVIGVSIVAFAAMLWVAGAGWTSPLAPASTSAASANSVTFEDSTAERPDSPDITTVVVSNTNGGQISFKINPFARLTDDMLIGIDLDTDSNASTGDPDTGADYAIELFRGTANLFRWDGSGFSRRQNDPLQATLSFSGLTIKINRSELGGTSRIGFDVIVITGIAVDSSGELDFNNAHADFAPDPGHGLWSYQVKTAALRLVPKSFALSPSRPRAGGLLTANLVVARNDTGAVLKGGTVTCTATVGGARVAVRVHKFVGNQARCAWQVPGSARGKSFRGAVTVLFEGKRISRSFTATVG
jgi:hypothetical protein